MKNSGVCARFKFLPTEEELVSYYLLKKAKGFTLQNYYPYMVERDLYGGDEATPSKVLGDILVDSTDEQVMYVVTRLSKIKNGDTRVTRMAGNGTWKGRSGVTDIRRHGTGELVGKRKVFNFKEMNTGKGSSDGYSWTMHEFSLAGVLLEENNDLKHKDYVICRITRKRIKERRSSCSYYEKNKVLPSNKRSAAAVVQEEQKEKPEGGAILNKKRKVTTTDTENGEPKTAFTGQPFGSDGLHSVVPMSPTKALRAANLKCRFADIIFKATHLVDNSRDKKPRLEKEEIAVKERFESEIKENLQRQRKREREAARMRLEMVEKTVDIEDNRVHLRDLMILSGSTGDGFGPGGHLEKLGLYMKDDYLKDEDEEGILMERERKRKAARMKLEMIEKTVEINDNCFHLRNLMKLSCSTGDGFGPGSHLEKLGLYMKDDSLNEEDEDAILAFELEEGEIV